MKTLTILAAVAATLLTGCTDNARARSFGGVTSIDLPQGTKFVTATWKEADLWYAFRPARPGEKPEAVTFQEQSSFGLVEGKVVFREH